ncbi:hypothetical protein Y032_0303g1891 [Ancylostoma ceylanicum]|uniref:Microsomal signal peptidase 25 kDa subunit n=1 Tax=Ancylostoma ceylanicum TaxID=53326 RepID=A0A016S3Y3_9BILA|nr:hypothetical protein Y032_0303g1891 [Ancylostoma ceylanicum]
MAMRSSFLFIFGDFAVTQMPPVFFALISPPLARGWRRQSQTHHRHDIASGEYPVELFVGGTSTTLRESSRPDRRTHALLKWSEMKGRQKDSFLSASSLGGYDDKYTLSAEFSKETRSGQGKITKSIGAYINEVGEVVVPLLKKDVDQLYDNLMKGEQ